jgi:glycosyltransferase involved in cell wall biosynthesis
MKFWLLTSEYPPQSGGGISTYSYHTAKMMADHNHHVTVFIPDGKIKNLKKSKQEERITLIYYPILDLDFLGYETALSYTLSNVLLKIAGEDGSPDFIEAQEYNGLAYYSLQRKWLEEGYLSNCPFFVTAHAPGFLYLEYNQAPTHSLPEFWIGEMERSVLISSDFVISPSKYLLDHLDLKTSSQDLHVVHNPYFSNIDLIEDFTRGDVVFFGKLTPQKGALEMLSYFEKSWIAGDQHTLSVIGGGDHFFYPKLTDMGDFVKKKYAHRIAQGLLKFEGHIAPENISERLSQAHVVVVPSIVDNLPYTVVEAMHLGKIVLASTDGGHKELIEPGLTGFIFDHAVDSDFIKQLSQILLLSAEEIHAIGKRAVNAIKEKCSYENVYNKKINILNQYKAKTTKYFPFIRPINKSKSHQIELGQKNKLSIVIPYYNMGQYVNETLTSIDNNNYKNYEVILVNDGSTDELSINILKKIEQENSNLTVYHKANTGLSETRNYGACKATGEFIAFLDPDDFIEPDYYTKAVYILNKFKNISFIGCWAQYFGKRNYIWPAFNPEPPFILAHNMVNSSALIIRRNDFLDFGINDSAFIYGMEDYDEVINLVKNGCGGVVIPECLWNYRIRRGSLAQSFNKFSKDYLYRLLTKKHEVFYQQYAKEVINLINSNGPSMNFDNPSKQLGRFHGINIPFKNSKLAGWFITNKFLRKIAKLVLKQLNV